MHPLVVDSKFLLLREDHTANRAGEGWRMDFCFVFAKFLLAREVEVADSARRQSDS